MITIHKITIVNKIRYNYLLDGDHGILDDNLNWKRIIDKRVFYCW